MLTKESKIKVLENFYALDYIFFGRLLKELKDSGCPVCKEEYLSNKGALMSIVIEMLKMVRHSSVKLTEQIHTKDLMKNARQVARESRENAKKIVTSKKSRENIKTKLREAIQSDEDVDVTKIVEVEIRKKAFCLAVDNLLIARMVSESKDYKKMNEWEGKILEDSYKILRDSLTEAVDEILSVNSK